MNWEILFYILLIITAICSGIAEALQDVITNRNVYSKAILRFPFLSSPFWDTYKSWLNKYSTTEKKGKNYWYYLGLYKPKYPEAFSFSTTLLVGFTDGFHLCKFVQTFHNLIWFTSVLYISPCWLYLGYTKSILFLLFIGFIIPMGSFHIFYRYFTCHKN